MGKAFFFSRKIMYFLLDFFSIHSKGEGPTITASSTGQDLSCNGWQSLSVSPGVQLLGLLNILLGEVPWPETEILADLSPLHSCKQETTELSQPLQQPIAPSVHFFYVSSYSPIRAMEKPGAAAGSGGFALDPPICLLSLLVCLYPGKKNSEEQ